MPLIVSWNLHQLDAPWRVLVEDASLDLALLQEARPPPAGVDLATVPPVGTPWTTAGYTRVHFRTAIAWRAERVRVRARVTGPLGTVEPGVIPVSRDGLLTVADVELSGGTITVVSAYACWESPVGDGERSWIYADASARLDDRHHAAAARGMRAVRRAPRTLDGRRGIV